MTDLRDQLADFDAAARRALHTHKPQPIPLTRYQDLGALLRTLRHDAGLSLNRLAAVAYVSKSALSKREHRSGLTVGALVEHAQALGYTVALVPLTDRRPA